MLEDVLGWVIVLLGAVTMKSTDFSVIAPVLSIIVAVFIMINALKSYKAILELPFEKVPTALNVEKVKEILLKLDELEEVQHIHIWSMDGVNNYAEMHIISACLEVASLKKSIKEKLKEIVISHVMPELEGADEECLEKEYWVHVNMHSHVHSHHHHGYHHGQHRDSGGSECGVDCFWRQMRREF